MAYNGYFTWGGAEFINASRTKAYCKLLRLFFVKNTFAVDGFAALVGDSAYVSPAADLAPWYDPHEPSSGLFAGVIPLDVSGIEDSSREAPYNDYISDGGQAGRMRHGSKAVVFSVVLVGQTEEACEYGFRWLKRTLLLPNCAPGTVQGCDGLPLAYALAVPQSHIMPADYVILDGGGPTTESDLVIDAGGPGGPDEPSIDGGGPDDPDLLTPTLWQRFERHLKNVIVRDGPKITSKQTIPNKGEFWVVQFTATAGNPYEYGYQKPILRALSDGGADPFVDGDGTHGSTTYTPEDCDTPAYLPLFDPMYPALLPPPLAPNVMPTAFEVPDGDWDRTYAELDLTIIPKWDEVRPVITIKSNAAADQRMIRIRFYPATAAVDADCGDVAEFLVSYLPQGYSLTIDTAEEYVYVHATDVATQRADSLVFGDLDGTPLVYFGLSCGMSYRVTMDWPASTTPDLELDLDLVPRTA